MSKIILSILFGVVYLFSSSILVHANLMNADSSVPTDFSVGLVDVDNSHESDSPCYDECFVLYMSISVCQKAFSISDLSILEEQYIPLLFLKPNRLTQHLISSCIKPHDYIFGYLDVIKTVVLLI